MRIVALLALLLGAMGRMPAQQPAPAPVSPTPPSPPPAPDSASVAPQAAAARPADVGSIDAILLALYDVISGPPGPRDWQRFRSLFAAGARLMPTRPRADGGAELLILDVEGYISRTDSFFRTNGFFEREIARRTEQFGNVAHAFSTYVSYRALGDATPFTRGINSIQLLKDGQRWWVVSIFWDSERAGLTIPAPYLPSPAGRAAPSPR
jgi:hypothetical protein